MENLQVGISHGDYRIPGDFRLLERTSGAILTVDTAACAVLNYPGSHSVVIQKLRLYFVALKKPGFPAPLSTEINCCLKVITHDGRAFFDQYVCQLRLLFCRCYTEPFQNVLPTGRHFVLVNLASFRTMPCISFHSPKKGRILGPPSLQLYCSKRIRGVGEGECLWGILVLFNHELRAVAWETKPKKK